MVIYWFIGAFFLAEAIKEGIFVYSKRRLPGFQLLFGLGELLLFLLFSIIGVWGWRNSCIFPAAFLLWNLAGAWYALVRKRRKKAGIGRAVLRLLVLAFCLLPVVLFPTMKTLDPKKAENKAEKAAVNGSAEAATVSAPSVQIDLSKVKIEPLFADDVDFETFSKSDFRVVKIEACEAVPKSKKLLKFTLNDGTDRKRTILSGIHEYYEPEELVGKTCVAITNLPPRKMMGIDSEGMLISAVYEYDGREGLNLLMLDDSIPAGAKLY